MINVGLPPILFQGRCSANQTIASASTWTSVLFDTEDFDDANLHSTSTITSRVTVSRAGTYRLTGMVLWNPSDATTTNTTLRQVRLFKNGSTIITGPYASGVFPGNYFTQTVGPFDATVAVGDYVELQVNSGLAGAILIGNTALSSFLRAEFIR